MIILYAVRQSDPSPVCGHDKTIARYDTREKAIAHAEKLTKTETDIYVEKRMYADEKNLSRDITFDSSYVWCSWMQKKED